MSTEIEKAKRKAVNAFFEQPNIKKKFDAMMGSRSPQFITSILQVVNQNDMLKNADPVSIYTAAATAATLDLPLNNNLGFAYIIPYNNKQKDGSFKTVAQFQIGYKGFIQLAQRSGQFKTISSAPVYEGQLIDEDPLTGFKFDWKGKTSDVVIGYAAYFELINGFQKTFYMDMNQVKAHGNKYSKTFSYSSSVWKKDFEAMALKTVTKLLLSKYAPLSVEMQKAVVTDQSRVIDPDMMEVEYMDNEPDEPIDKNDERVRLLLEQCNTVKEVDALKLGDEYDIQVSARKDELQAMEVK